MNWRLMTDDAITEIERDVMAFFIRNSNKFTQGQMVRDFEEAWSKWLGCRYSVFVNSGSSADLLIVRALSGDDRPTWVSQACTWSTAVSPIMQFGHLQLCDINLNNFGPDLKNLEHLFKHEKPKFLLLTHILGFCALSNDLLDLCSKYNVTIVEDCCESHGVSFKKRKGGTYGIASSFSFYYGHHMTTIEGGMICTDDKKLYHDLLLLRSHGLLRELPKRERAKRTVANVDPSFTFLRDGFNVRNTELHAKLGLLQLPHLDAAIEHRNENFRIFINNLKPFLYKTYFITEGCSNYALPIFTKSNRMPAVKEKLKEMNIEYRPLISGNLFEHPFMKSINQFQFDDNAKIIHDSCIYVGNHKDITPSMVKDLCEALNSITET